MCLIISRGRKEGRKEVSEKVTECAVTYIAEETFCFKSDLAVKPQAQNSSNGFPWTLSAQTYHFRFWLNRDLSWEGGHQILKFFC